MLAREADELQALAGALGQDRALDPRGRRRRADADDRAGGVADDRAGDLPAAPASCAARTARCRPSGRVGGAVVVHRDSAPRSSTSVTCAASRLRAPADARPRRSRRGSSESTGGGGQFCGRERPQRRRTASRPGRRRAAGRRPATATAPGGGAAGTRAPSKRSPPSGPAHGWPPGAVPDDGAGDDLAGGVERRRRPHGLAVRNGAPIARRPPNAAGSSRGRGDLRAAPQRQPHAGDAGGDDPADEVRPVARPHHHQGVLAVVVAEPAAARAVGDVTHASVGAGRADRASARAAVRCAPRRPRWHAEDGVALASSRCSRPGPPSMPSSVPSAP